MIRLARGFVRFWYDFIVGDSMVLAIAAPVVLALAYVFARSDEAAIVQVFFPVAIIVTLVASLAFRSDS